MILGMSIVWLRLKAAGAKGGWERGGCPGEPWCPEDRLKTVVVSGMYSRLSTMPSIPCRHPQAKYNPIATLHITPFCTRTCGRPPCPSSLHAAVAILLILGHCIFVDSEVQHAIPHLLIRQRHEANRKSSQIHVVRYRGTQGSEFTASTLSQAIGTGRGFTQLAWGAALEQGPCM